MSCRGSLGPFAMLPLVGRMARSTQVIAVAALLAAGFTGGCRASGTSPLTRPSDTRDGGVIVEGSGGGAPSPGGPEVQPHAVLGIEPAHGPFSGGTLALIRGNGFRSNARVWFGAVPVPEADVVVVDPRRIQVRVPAGETGLADVSTQNGEDTSTLAVLKDGYAYDSFYADPPTGPTSGGSLITLHGEGTDWNEETVVSIDRKPCELVELRGPDELVCRTPKGSPGAKVMRVVAGGDSIDVLDGFTYSDSDNGFRGGLAGGPIDGELSVLVFDAISGQAIPQASVLVGADEPLVVETDVSGGVVISGESVSSAPTVTVAKHCFQPTTFVEVPVDSLTVYLEPVLSPNCFSPEGEIPRGGGTPGQGAGVSGEVVWPESAEFRRSGWTNVPDPKSTDEVEVAYVFQLASQPAQRFNLPSAVAAVTPLAEGERGYRFNLSTAPGNYTLYALAGLENRARSPYVFTPYALGIIRGVAVPAGRTAENIFIRVDIPLDHAIELELDGPKPTSRGPDRMLTSIAIQVGNEGYVLLPGARSETLLSGPARVPFVGIPPLVGALAGASYVASARAVTGDAGGLPRSVVASARAGATSGVVTLGSFVEIPILTQPSRNGLWNGRDIQWRTAAGGQEPDLTIIDVLAAGGLYDWRIVAAGNPQAVRLPDLRAVHAELAWPRGDQSFVVSLAHIANFGYGRLRYGDLSERGWTSHASDAFSAAY